MPTSHPLALICALALTGCRGPADDVTDASTGNSGSTTDEPSPFDPTETPNEHTSAVPQETAWVLLVDAHPFPDHITTLTVGREEYFEKFANRGKVEVLYDHDEPTISVEMRLYDFTTDEAFYGSADHEGLVERSHLWAHVSAGAPAPPEQMPPGSDCTVGKWKDDCTITLYSDFKAHPARSGADLRVRLPRSYRGALNVFTEHNDAEPSYPRLGDVTIDGLCGSGRVSLGHGSAAIKLCRDLSPAPTCPEDQVTACEQFTDAMGNDAAWSLECPCSPALYGQLLVESRAPFAADITVDVPATPWMNLQLANKEPLQPHACAPQLADCDPDTCTLGPSSAAAEFNDPGPAAPSGGGYQLTAVASACGPVAYVAAPDLWQDGPGFQPMLTELGHVRVCTDCL